MTLQELHDATSIDKKPIAELVRELRRVGLVYIDAWEDDAIGRPQCVPRYAWCGEEPKKDAKVVRQSHNKVKAASRARMTAHLNPLLQLGRPLNAATPEDDQLDP